MELFTLIVINFVTAVALYIVFSVRFSLSVDKIVERTRKNEVLKDLRENIEATVEYINTSLDLMDQKNRSFYQLVRRSEELIQNLEKQNAAGSARPGFGAAAPQEHFSAETLTEQEMNALQAPLEQSAPLIPAHRPVDRNAREEPGDPDSLQGMNVAPEMESPEMEALDDPEEEPAFADERGTTLDRVLDALGDDRLEISGDGGGSTEEMFRRGEQSARFAQQRRFQPTRRPEKLKSGLYPDPGAGFTMDDVGSPESAARAASGWLSFMEGAGRTVRRIFGMNEMNQPAAGERPPRATASDEGEGEWRSPPRPEPRENPFDLLVRDKQERLAGRPAPGPREDEYSVSEPLPFEEGEPARSLTDYQRSRFGRVGETADRDEGAAAGEDPGQIEDLRERIKASTPAGRREIILQMVQRGYSRQNISALTGIARAEVDLVASLPAAPVRRRRFRHQ